MSTHLRRDPADKTRVSAPDLRKYFLSGGKSREEWRVGAEFEKFALDRATGKQLGFDACIEETLERLTARFGWEPHREAGRLTTLTRDQSTISVEPGGQLELSTPPASNVSELKHHLESHLAELRAVSDSRTVAWVAAGVTPFSCVEEIPLNPRPRHHFMAQYLPQRCQYGLHMMKATASTQVTFDYADEADAGKKFAVALALSPIVNACFANAPVHAGKETGFVSFRCEIWHGMDPDRSGFLVELLEDDFTFDRWIDFVLDVPLLFTDIEGQLLPAPGITFREWMDRGLNGRWPTMVDWEIHLSTIFTEVRLKRYLEIRGADATPAPLSIAVPAIWKGLLYDSQALAAAAELAVDFPASAMIGLSKAMGRLGLKAEYRGRTIAEWGKEVAGIASGGLQRLLKSTSQADESVFLAPLWEILESGGSPGDLWLRSGSVTQILACCEY